MAVYTGHGHGKQTQNLAVSHDRGRTCRKYEGNPVLDLSRGDHRDPKVFWHEPSRRWIMVSVLAGERKVRFFASSDLKRWETLSDFGPAGATGRRLGVPGPFPPGRGRQPRRTSVGSWTSTSTPEVGWAAPAPSTSSAASTGGGS